MDRKIVAWLKYEDFLIYLNGGKTIAWSTQSTKEYIQILVPFEDIIDHKDHGDYGVELNLQLKK